MNAKLIFKMELYKFINDKKYLIAAGVLALLNTFLTIQLVDSVNSYSYYYSDSAAAFTGITALVYMASFVFLFSCPFHILSQDYKNNVMALMVASGVNRTKLYFSKIGSAILCSLGMLFVTIIIPIVIITIKYGSFSAIGDLLDLLSDGFGYLGISQFLFIIFLLVSYILEIVIINVAIIFAKGSSKAIFFFFGFSFCYGIVTQLFGATQTTYGYNMNGDLIYSIVLNLIVIAAFGALSLRQMRVQNL